MNEVVHIARDRAHLSIYYIGKLLTIDMDFIIRQYCYNAQARCVRVISSTLVMPVVLACFIFGAPSTKGECLSKDEEISIRK